MSIKLYVGNFPQETSESDLRTLFEASGEVASVTVIRDRATGRASGYAFIDMRDVAGARKAISELDKHQYGGRSLAVNEAKPMHPRGLFDGGIRQRSSNGATSEGRTANRTCPPLRGALRRDPP
jgi:RNA recognition motif-containing protein